MLPLRVANNAAATVKLDVPLGELLVVCGLTTSILDGDVASATLDLLRGDECVSTARVTVQALPGETLSRKLHPKNKHKWTRGNFV